MEAIMQPPQTLPRSAADTPQGSAPHGRGLKVEGYQGQAQPQAAQGQGRAKHSSRKNAEGEPSRGPEQPPLNQPPRRRQPAARRAKGPAGAAGPSRKPPQDLLQAKAPTPDR